MLSADELRRLLHYDPKTGVFVWLVDRQRPRAGAAAGYIDGHGYRTIMIGQKNYHAHRLAWVFMTGEWPTKDIDHKNRDGSDNRWSNLRLASMSENLINAKLNTKNKSGAKGVSWYERQRKWRAYISFQGKQISLGYHDDFEDACAAREAKAKELYGEFA